MTTENDSTQNAGISEPSSKPTRSSSWNPANHLPLEIVEDILLHVPRIARTQTLHSCCLVNRQWHHLAMRRLWESVVLNRRNLELFAVGANLLGTEGMGQTLSVRGLIYAVNDIYNVPRPAPLIAALPNPVFNNLQFLRTRVILAESDLQLIFTVCQNLVAISCWVRSTPGLAGFSEMECIGAAVSKLRVLHVHFDAYADSTEVDDFIDLCAANVGNSLESWKVTRSGAGPDVFPNISYSSLKDYDCQYCCFDSANELKSFLLNHGTQLVRFGFDDLHDEESNFSCSVPILSLLLDAAPNLKQLAQCQLRTEWLNLLAKGPHLYSIDFGDPDSEDDTAFSPASLFNYLQQRGQLLRNLCISYTPPCFWSDDYLQIVLDCCPNLEIFRTDAAINLRDSTPGAGDGTQGGPEGGPANGVTEAGMRHFLETAGARLKRVGCCWNHSPDWLLSECAIDLAEGAARLREVAARKDVELVCCYRVGWPTYFDLVWDEALAV
ncbi:hypothetical protein HK104_002065 [Borealophlyctis nickersoniae]|nr:hypothetical protein HK104_002065 [Borealophlyctis nickersoniae]